MVKGMLIFGACGYVVLVGVLIVAQRTMLYHPVATHLQPAEASLAEAQEVVLDTSDGEKVIVWHVPPRGDMPVVIYFHGNAEIVAWRTERHRALIANGTGLIALSYRGYAGSTGSPTEAGLHRDADAAYAFAVSRYAPERLVLWGHSLGTGVAVRLAAEKPVGKVILEAPYTSTVDIAAALFPFVPVRWLMLDQFHSDERIGAVRAPLLIMHGARDATIPIVFGERLFALAREPKQLVRFSQAGHNDLDDYGAIETARRFIAAAMG